MCTLAPYMLLDLTILMHPACKSVIDQNVKFVGLRGYSFMLSMRHNGV
jgi:hypothetical protein